MAAYFAWRGDGYGRAAGAELDGEEPPVSEEIRALEERRVDALAHMMEDWGCVYAGARTTLRLDKAFQSGNTTVIWLYEAGYFTHWYPGYTRPEAADTSGSGVRHVLRLSDGRITGDAYHEGRPTNIASAAVNEDAEYVAYAGAVSPPPEPVTGEPPALPVNAPVFAVGYSPAKALEYAEKWALGRNPDERDYTLVGGDCCHFVSQCLRAGGLPGTEEWAPGKRAFINSTSLVAYLTKTANAGRGVAVIRSHDPTGRRASLGGKSVKAARLIYPGSPVFYRWGGGHIADNKWSHTTICVGTLGDGTPAVNSHTGDKYRFKWNYGGEECDYGTVQMTAARKCEYKEGPGERVPRGLPCTCLP